MSTKNSTGLADAIGQYAAAVGDALLDALTDGSDLTDETRRRFVILLRHSNAVAAKAYGHTPTGLDEPTPRERYLKESARHAAWGRGVDPRYDVKAEHARHQAEVKACREAAEEQSTQPAGTGDLWLSLATWRALGRSCVSTIAELEAMTDDELLALDQIGPTRVAEIHAALAKVRT